MPGASAFPTNSSSRNLLFVTQRYDATSTILGVTADWVHALARRFRRVDVLALAAGPRPLAAPANVVVHSLGKERGSGRIGQLARFYAVAARLATHPSSERPGAILAHMVPRYAVLAAPVARLLRIPLVLWYAQGGVSRELRLANRLVDRVVSASRGSYPLDDRRLVVVGHGIDTTRYTPAAPEQTSGVPLLLSVGRLSPVKDYETALTALSLLHRHGKADAGRMPPSLRICGAPLSASDTAYAQHLRQRVGELGLGDAVEFAGDVPYAAMLEEYHRAAVFVHTSRTGSLDKVALEAMACGVPVVTCNPAVQDELGSWWDVLSFPAGDAAALAARIEAVLGWAAGERQAADAIFRQRVVVCHSLEQWADRVVALLDSLC